MSQSLPWSQPESLSTPLLDEEKEDERLAVDGHDVTVALSQPSRRSVIYMFTSLALNLALAAAIVWSFTDRASMVLWRGDPPVYSPIQDSVTHNKVLFTALTGRTKYHGPPNDEVDREWEALYTGAISAIPAAQAELLPNKTQEIRGTGGKYLMQLDIFHQLHCLNTIRKFQSPERYPHVVAQRYRHEAGYGTIDHIDHCIQAIREALMCIADTAMDSFIYREDSGHSEVWFESMHTCHDFDAIQKWAIENRSPYKFSDSVMAHGALEFDPEYLSQHGGS